VHTATVNGTTLSYEEVGHGPAALVLHGGLGLDHTSYRDLDMLADRLRLVYYDHRGNGRSARPPLDTLTMPQLADDADALAERLGLGPVVVIGHSYGGFIAQELALRHPGRVAALVLVGTGPGGPGGSDPPDEDQGPPPPAEFLAAVASAPPTDAAFAAGFRPLLRLYLHRRDPAEVGRVFERTVYDAAALTRSMQVLAGWSAADRLGAVRAPTLVLVGAYDRIISPAQARRIARRVPGAELVEFADSGHYPWLEEPDRFAAVVGGWLDRLPAAANAAVANQPAPARV
jgi:proline iminopeptidase